MFSICLHFQYCHHFCDQGHARVVSLLVQNGEDPDEFGYFGMTPLMLAAYESHLSAVDVLLNCGADPDVAGRMGGTSIGSVFKRIGPGNEVCHVALVDVWYFV